MYPYDLSYCTTVSEEGFLKIAPLGFQDQDLFVKHLYESTYMSRQEGSLLAVVIRPL